MAQSHERAAAAPATACFERRLTALLGELESPVGSHTNLRARSDACAAAFEAVQRDVELSPPERERLRGLIAAALDAAARDLEAVRSRLKLTQAVLRASRSSNPITPVGDWCDIAG